MSFQRVLCFGGRDYGDAGAVNAALDLLMQERHPLRGAAIVHGDARGADRLAGEWGRRHGMPVIVVPANWTYYKLKAGSLRNQWMLDFCQPTYAVRFPGGIGTAHMSRLLEAAGVPVWEPYP